MFYEVNCILGMVQLQSRRTMSPLTDDLLGDWLEKLLILTIKLFMNR